MSIYFVDTSALIKRYVTEPGSTWVRNWVVPAAGNTIIISRLTTVEVVAGLARRQRENSISTSDFTTLRGAFIQHTDQFYVVIGLRKHVLTAARELTVKHPLRTLDAIQLASAIFAETALSIKLTFVSSDRQQLNAASAEGFTVDDPNLHP